VVLLDHSAKEHEHENCRMECKKSAQGKSLDSSCMRNSKIYRLVLNYSYGFHGLSLSPNVTCQRIARQRLDKHPALRSRNNRTNVYSLLLGNSQRASGLAT
jgi:hypothetical protein